MVERLRYYAGLKNFGDDINPYLYEAIFLHEPHRMHVFDQTPEDHLLMCGSIMGFCNAHSIVCGAGFISRTAKWIEPPKDIKLLRGPVSRKIAEGLGGTWPSTKKWKFDEEPVYGDPVLLLPHVMGYVEEKVEYEYGWMPHYIDRKIPCPIPGAFFIDVQGDVDQVITDVTRCEKIVSSGLHGLILADALGKPALWVKVSDNLSGDGTKFEDYFAGVGSVGRECIELTEDNGPHVGDFFKPYELTYNVESILDAIKNH